VPVPGQHDSTTGIRLLPHGIIVPIYSRHGDQVTDRQAATFRRSLVCPLRGSRDCSPCSAFPASSLPKHPRSILTVPGYSSTKPYCLLLPPCTNTRPHRRRLRPPARLYLGDATPYVRRIRSSSPFSSGYPYNLLHWVPAMCLRWFTANTRLGDLVTVSPATVISARIACIGALNPSTVINLFAQMLYEGNNIIARLTAYSSAHKPKEYQTEDEI
jgi:hypothetical protein